MQYSLIHTKYIKKSNTELRITAKINSEISLQLLILEFQIQIKIQKKYHL